jgi:glycosyltransferase involved in cell wall biosynthesis
LVNLAMGGAQTFFVQLAVGLTARGHDLAYWLSANPSDPVYVHPLLKISLEAVARQVRYPWELWSADVIHLDGYHSLRRKLLYLPHWKRCLETYHSAYSVRRSGPIYPPHRVAVSEVVGKQLPAPCQVIYQGVAVPVIPLSGKKQYDIAILGRIHPVKNHRLFLAICEVLYQRRGHCAALIIGEHIKANAYQVEIDQEIALLRQQGVHLEMTGNLAGQDLEAYLSQVRVLLVTSQQEGFGRMAVEAMAAGVPVVANPVGGLREIIRPGETGFFAEENQVVSFVDHVERLLDDETLLGALGQRAWAFARQHFSLDRMLSDYETLYRQIEGKP